jgi:hypothetical protein
MFIAEVSLGYFSYPFFKTAFHLLTDFSSQRITLFPRTTSTLSVKLPKLKKNFCLKGGIQVGDADPDS